MTEEARRKISEEEIYRQEVRQRLDAGQAAGARFWKFLNSNFGIFLLSTVVVTILTGAYTQWQESRKCDRDRETHIAKLDREIGNRIAQVLRHLDLERVKVRQAWYAPGAYPKAGEAFAFAGAILDNEVTGARGRHYSLYPELSNFSYAALITDLSNTLAGAAGNSLDRSLQGYGTLQEEAIMDAHRGSLDSASYAAALIEARRIVQGSIHQSRWPYMIPLRRELLR